MAHPESVDATTTIPAIVNNFFPVGIRKFAHVNGILLVSVNSVIVVNQSLRHKDYKCDSCDHHKMRCYLSHNFHHLA